MRNSLIALVLLAACHREASAEPIFDLDRDPVWRALQASDAWDDCIKGTAARFARTSSESAEVIMRGVLAFCQNAEVDALSAHMAISDHKDNIGEFGQKVWPPMRKRAQDIAIGVVLDIRSRR